MKIAILAIKKFHFECGIPQESLISPVQWTTSYCLWVHGLATNGVSGPLVIVLGSMVWLPMELLSLYLCVCDILGWSIKNHTNWSKEYKESGFSAHLAKKIFSL